MTKKTTVWEKIIQGVGMGFMWGTMVVMILSFTYIYMQPHKELVLSVNSFKEATFELVFFWSMAILGTYSFFSMIRKI